MGLAPHLGKVHTGTKAWRNLLCSPVGLDIERKDICGKAYLKVEVANELQFLQ
jgi:hypothetical protein